ncbi:MAG: hypothetical protein EBQ95_04260 [Gammaproteobacteria bacterium]|nr:hypothetical protein [Gammaproteobacteria bacterium]
MNKRLWFILMIMYSSFASAQSTPCMQRCFDVAINRCMEKCGKGPNCENACHEKIKQPCHDYCQSSPF